jgi:hypothetical protein
MRTAGRCKREGLWLYEHVAPTLIRIDEVDWLPSSGDYEDPPEEREDKKGTFYRLSYTAAGSSHFSNIRGYFHTLEDSVHEAEKVFTGIKWKS